MMMERHYIIVAFFEGIFQLDFMRDKKTNNNRHAKKAETPTHLFDVDPFV